MVTMTWRQLRLRRMRLGISKVAMADRLGCSVQWVSMMELYNYNGPARQVWAERYMVALDELFEEKKAAAREARSAAANKA